MCPYRRRIQEPCTTSSPNNPHEEVFGGGNEPLASLIDGLFR
ncbi:hypothetical protein OROHE_021840 [Orobanche hederae]